MSSSSDEEYGLQIAEAVAAYRRTPVAHRRRRAFAETSASSEETGSELSAQDDAQPPAAPADSFLAAEAQARAEVEAEAEAEAASRPEGAGAERPPERASPLAQAAEQRRRQTYERVLSKSQSSTLLRSLRGAGERRSSTARPATARSRAASARGTWGRAPREPAEEPAPAPPKPAPAARTKGGRPKSRREPGGEELQDLMAEARAVESQLAARLQRIVDVRSPFRSRNWFAHLSDTAPLASRSAEGEKADGPREQGLAEAGGPWQPRDSGQDQGNAAARAGSGGGGARVRR